MMNEKIDSPIRLRNRNVPRYLPIPKNYLGTFSNEIRRQGDEQDEQDHEEMLYKSTTDKDKGSKALISCDSFDLESSKELNIYNDLAFNFRKLIVNYSSSDSDGIDDADNVSTTDTKTFYNINELVDSSDEESVVENEGHISSEQKIIFSKTTKDKALLICGDHQYIFEKKHKSKMYWRCNYESYKKGKKHCKQRLHTDLDCKPLKLTKTVHNHDSDDPEDIENILVINRIKERSKQTIENPRTIINDALSNLPRSSTHLIASKENLTQQISRVRRRQNGPSKSNPKNRMEISIPEELRKTNSGSDFVLFDSGENDPDRLIILATDENLSFLNLSKLWCIDGTFDISPSLFRQLFTINVLVNGRNLPVLYAFLADKTEKIYTRLFEFIKSRVNNEPENLFCDFEKGILNSIEKCYKRTNISGCWFHLVSNLYKHVQSNGLVTAYKSQTDNRFRKCFKYLKFLAFIPPQDVIDGFYLIKKISPYEFNVLLNYFEKFYIGKQLDNDASKRAVPLYPIKYWNVHKRILKDLPRTNNNIEAWHKSLAQDIESHPNLNKLLKHLHKEQRLTEQLFDEIKAGKFFERCKKERFKDERIKAHLKTYVKSSQLDFLDGLIEIFGNKQKEIISNDSETENN